MSSTNNFMCSKLIGPILCVRSPSANVCDTCSAANCTSFPDFKLSLASAASSGSTPYHPHIGSTQLDRCGHAAYQSSTPDWEKHGLNLRKILEDLQPYRALPGDDVLIVIGWHHDVSVFGGQFLRLLHALHASRTDQYNLRAQRSCSFSLDGRSICWHHDHSFHIECAGRVRNTLGVIPT